jgi:peptide/nickel transport system substrate-binding protein
MRPMLRRDLNRLALLSPLAVPLLARGAQAQAAAGATLNIAIGGGITSIDPHFFAASPNHTAAFHLFDRLVNRTANAGVEPCLALSWKAVSETEWEFKLRPGVTWHDGQPFTADDVVFTYSRARNVPNSPGGFGSYLSTIKTAEAVDPLTLRITTHAPSPILPRQLTSVHVVSRHAGEGASTADYNSGKAAIGTGPYKFVRYVPGDRFEVVRNDAWWGAKQEWERVVIRHIAAPPARTAALLSGEVAIIDNPPASDLPRLRAAPNLELVQTQGLRVIYLGPDFSHPENPPEVTDNEGKPFARSPLLDKRVRQALSVAINRQALAERVMQNMASPTAQWMPPGVFGYAPEVKPPAFEPERAKALLAEAGFPQGFRITIRTPNDRYPNDAATAQAVAQMWTRAGVQTRVEAMPWSAYVPRAAGQEYSMCLWGWGSGTGEGSNVLNGVLATYDKAKGRGASNDGRYSNPELDALTDRVMSTIDDAEREKLIRQGVALAAEELPIIPLFMLTNAWAVQKGIRYEPRADELTLAMGVHRA